MGTLQYVDRGNSNFQTTFDRLYKRKRNGNQRKVDTQQDCIVNYDYEYRF